MKSSGTFSVEAVDAHAEGQVGRVVMGGVGVLNAPGKTMFERMKHFEQHADDFRRLMINEPRGYPVSCVNLVLPPCRPEAHAGVVIMETQKEYPAMSGTNTMCVSTVLLETGIVPMKEPVTELFLDMPAGLVHVRADCEGGKVKRVTFRNVPCFATLLDVPLEVKGFGTLKVDVAYGGMTYVHVDAEKVGVDLTPKGSGETRRVGMTVWAAAHEQLQFKHPENPKINLIEGTAFYQSAKASENDLRTTVVLKTGQMDRSPCGTGVCSRMAALHAKGLLPINRPMRFEGILGGIFHGKLVEEVSLGGQKAVIPEIGGRAWIYAYTRFVLSDDDPFPEGFRMGDIWPVVE